MKEPWQQQQEQMRRQQEMMRLQQEEARRQREMAAHYAQQNAERSAQDKSSQTALNDKFTQVEAAASQLRQEFTSGRLSDEKFKAQLKELMVQDERNNWWMIGADTGAWYRHDGSNWVQAVPPGHLNQHSWHVDYQVPYVQNVQKRGHLFRAILYFIFGLALTAGLGLGVAFVIESFQPGGSVFELAVTILIWLVGFVLVVRHTRKIWRGT